jgi:hypothetical protein
MSGRPEEGLTDAMHYATTNGIGSRIFFPAAKAMLEAQRGTIDCLSKPFSIGRGPAFLGAIFRSVSGIGKSFTSASAVGEEWDF